MKIKFFSAVIFISLAVTANSQTNHNVSGDSICFICPPCNLPCDTIQFQKPGICPYCGMKLYASYSAYRNKNGEHHDNIEKKVAVVLFPGVEIIDFSGPWEVFGAAGMNVFSVAASDTVIATSMGLQLKPDYSFSNAPAADIIVVPGGNVDVGDTTTVQWIKSMNSKTEHTMSVCTGSFYLAAGGLLDNLKSTTHFSSIKALQQFTPHTHVVDTVRYVDNGRIITSAGLSAGIDAAFHVVSLYIGKGETKKLANDLEYNWNEDEQFVRGKLADKYVSGFLNALTPFDYTMIDYKGNESKWLVTLSLKTELSQHELEKLFAYQFEIANGWKQTQRKNNWFFSEDGKRWNVSIELNRKTNESYYLKLNVAAQ